MKKDEDLIKAAEEMFEMAEKIKDKVGEDVEELLDTYSEYPTFMLISILTNATVKTIGENAPCQDSAESTLLALCEAMQMSLKIMIEEKLCGFQQTKQ